MTAVLGIDAAWTAHGSSGIALLCAWIGIQYLAQHATPYGDHPAAIWVPA